MNSFLVSLVVLPFVSLAEVTGFDTNVACPADGSKDCSKAKCCATAGDKCYQKNNWWASCKPICTKGIDPADPPKYQQPWTCKVLGTGPPAGDCPKDGSESCLAQKCCATPGQKCYMKNNYWAACMDSCTPGINPLDPPKHQSPWSCKVVGSGPPPAPPAPPPPPPAPEPKPPAPEPSPPPAATRRRRRAAKKPAGTAVHRRRRRSGAVARRRRRRRRRSSGLKLHRRRRRSTTGGLASLRRRRSSGPSPAPKPPPVAISRRRRSPRPSPRPVSSIRRRRARPAPRPAPPPSAPEPAPRPGCSAPGEDCRSTKCCTDPGEACYEKSKYWGGCKESCTPGIDPNDPPEYQDPWSCRLLGDPPIPGLRRRRSDPAPAPSPSGGGGGGGGGSKKSGKKIKGHLTMWAMNDALIGSQCEYANAPVGSTTDPMLPSYLRTGFHCAIGDANPGFGKGEHCGKCYELVSTSDRGTGGTPGKKGSAIVTVSNGGAGGPAHFDCIMESFEQSLAQGQGSLM